MIQIFKATIWFLCIPEIDVDVIQHEGLFLNSPAVLRTIILRRAWMFVVSEDPPSDKQPKYSLLFCTYVSQTNALNVFIELLIFVTIFINVCVAFYNITDLIFFFFASFKSFRVINNGCSLEVKRKLDRFNLILFTRTRAHTRTALCIRKSSIARDSHRFHVGSLMQQITEIINCWITRSLFVVFNNV